VSDIQSLDDIMSGRGKPDSDDTTGKEPTTAADPSAQQPKDRDEKGRFAQKQEPTAAAPATATAPAAGDPAATGDAPGTAPIQALDAERRRRKESEDRYERELKQARDEIARLQPKEAPKPAAAKPQMWDDPNAFIDDRLMPVQHQLLDVREMVSENMAIGTHGADAVNAAKTALEQIAATPQGQQIVQELMEHRHPMDALVKWHKRQSAVTEVGDDPEAYFQRRLAAWQATQTQGGGQPAPAALQTPAPAPAALPTAFADAPSSGPRGGPEYGGPRPLSEIMKR
jgi:hypothetical protein